MAVTVNQALVAKLGINNRNFVRGMTQSQRRAQQTAERMKRTFRVASAAVAAVGVAALALGKKIFDVGSAVLETRSKFETVFGAATEQTRAFLAEFATIAGLSQSQAEALTATTGSIVQGMGFAQQASAAFSQEVLKLAGDLSSFNNLPTEETLRAINSALTGEREPLKRLGIVLREADVQQRALNNSGKAAAALLTDQEKATASLQLITERAGVAIGDLARTQDSAANVAKRLGARFREISEEVSVKLLPALVKMLPVVERIATAAGNAAERLGRLASALGDPVLEGMRTALRKASGDLESLKAFHADVRAEFNQTITRIGELSDQMAQGIAPPGTFGQITDLQEHFGRLRTILDETNAAFDRLQNPPTTSGSVGGGLPAIGPDVGRQAVLRAAGADMAARANEAVRNFSLMDTTTGSIATTFSRVSKSLRNIEGQMKETTTEAKRFAGVLVNDVLGALTALTSGSRNKFGAFAKAAVAIGGNLLLPGLGTFVGSLLPFQRGGVVPGFSGAPQPILAHAGEVVLSRQAVMALGGPQRAEQLNRGEAPVNVTVNVQGEVRDMGAFERSVTKAVKSALRRRAL